MRILLGIPISPPQKHFKVKVLVNIIIAQQTHLSKVGHGNRHHL